MSLQMMLPMTRQNIGAEMNEPPLNASAYHRVNPIFRILKKPLMGGRESMLQCPTPLYARGLK